MILTGHVHEKKLVVLKPVQWLEKNYPPTVSKPSVFRTEPHEKTTVV